MPTYQLTAININSFNLGESDRLLTVFSAERGLTKVVAKGARKPGARLSGKSELLIINQLLVSTGRTLDIINQAQVVESFPKLRNSLTRLAFGLYYLELIKLFGVGLVEESEIVFKLVKEALHLQANANVDAVALCLTFELSLLQLLGYQPELTCCVECRQVLSDLTIAAFELDKGGVICLNCYRNPSTVMVKENYYIEYLDSQYKVKTYFEITPLVWQHLVLATVDNGLVTRVKHMVASLAAQKSLLAAHQLIQNYLEYRAGRQTKALKLLDNLV